MDRTIAITGSSGYLGSVLCADLARDHRVVGIDRRPPSPALRHSIAGETCFYIARTPVMMEGRIELLQYYRQQSVCTNYYRYGNLGFRAEAFTEEYALRGNDLVKEYPLTSSGASPKHAFSDTAT
jgi:hypothetical protein